MGVSENVVYPIVPNGFADHYPYEKYGYFIGNINPTFSDKPTCPNHVQEMFHPKNGDIKKDLGKL